MPQPQSGIIPDPSPNALFLILRVREPATHGSAVAKVAAGVPSLVNKVGTIDPRAKLVCTVGFGSEFWDVISQTNARLVSTLSGRSRPMAEAPPTPTETCSSIFSPSATTSTSSWRRGSEISLATPSR